VGSASVIRISRYDFPEEEACRVPREAARIAAYFTSVVEGTIGGSALGGSTGVRCQRHPGQASCAGAIQSELHADRDKLWWCPVCEDNGVISNRAGTRWDPTRKGRETGGPRVDSAFFTERRAKEPRSRRSRRLRRQSRSTHRASRWPAGSPGGHFWRVGPPRDRCLRGSP
jgi:hypothetical protein